MHYGIYLPNFGAFGDIQTLANLARDAEQAGWDGFFIWDHVAGWGTLPMADPVVGLTAAAMQTTRIRLGTTVTPLPRRRPAKLAREFTSLDRLSGGRMILGVGTGGGDGEWGNLGEEAEPRVRGAMLDEALEVLTGLWRGESFNYDGDHYRVREATFQPTPVQSPRVPIWVGGFWPHKRPFRRAARWDGVFPLFQTENFDEIPNMLRDVVAYIEQHRASTEPFDVVAAGITPGDDPDQAAAIIGEHAEAGATWWLEEIAPYRADKGFEMPWPREALIERVHQGPPPHG